MSNTLDFSQWQESNGKTGSRFDYAHLALRGYVSHADGLLAFGGVFWPQLRLIDGLVIVAELYSEEKLVELRNRGMSPNELEYWMNLFSVDGFLEGVSGASPGHAEAIADILVASWTARANLDFTSGDVAAELITDGESGDVCVTLSRRRVGATQRFAQLAGKVPVK